MSLAETRLALFALDIQETGLSLLSLLLMSGISLTCFALALVLVTLLVVVIFWDTPIIGLRRRDGFLCAGWVEFLVGGIGEIPRHPEILCGNTPRVC